MIGILRFHCAQHNAFTAGISPKGNGGIPTRVGPILAVFVRAGIFRFSLTTNPKADRLYEPNCIYSLRICRGLSVPFTVSARGEPCSSGRRGQASFETESARSNCWNM